VSNSAASPLASTRSCSPRTSRRRPLSTYNPFVALVATRIRLPAGGPGGRISL
jgi:hypothetical protein